MNRFSIFIWIVIALIVSACGTEAVPTVDPADIQKTAVAAAFTAVAGTQTALPTATPAATATLTPMFVATLLSISTLEATLTPTPEGSSGVADLCVNTPLPVSLTGRTIKIRVDNPTKSTIMVSFYLQQGSPQGLCGYRGYSLAAGQSLVINNLVEGCYSVWAWNPDPKKYFMVTNGTSCLDQSNSWTFDISPNGIRLR